VRVELDPVARRDFGDRDRLSVALMLEEGVEVARLDGAQADHPDRVSQRDWTR
jgi:hypothetical protein